MLHASSAEVLTDFCDWLDTLDGGKLSAKTVRSYHTCIQRTLETACDGDLHQLLKYEEWTAAGGYLSLLSAELSPSTVGTYLRALSCFVGYLGKKKKFSSDFVAEAQAAFERWNLSMRDGRKNQKMAQVAKAQVVVPTTASQMKKYETCQQYWYELLTKEIFKLLKWLSLQ